jgi:hypothetical protein
VVERLRIRRGPTWLGPTALLLLSLAGVFAVLWGYFNPPLVRIVYHDAGLVSRFAIGEVTAYPEVDLYVVGMDDGRLRALDGRIEGTSCTVDWRPDDPRGVPHNMGGRPGVFEDPCTGATWSRVGDAISGTLRPLRTPYVNPKWDAEAGEMRIFVELINP